MRVSEGFGDGGRDASEKAAMMPPVVHNDDDFTALDGFDGLWDGVQLRHGTKVHR